MTFGVLHTVYRTLFSKSVLLPVCWSYYLARLINYQLAGFKGMHFSAGCPVKHQPGCEFILNKLKYTLTS